VAGRPPAGRSFLWAASRSRAAKPSLPGSGPTGKPHCLTTISIGRVVGIEKTILLGFGVKATGPRVLMPNWAATARTVDLLRRIERQLNQDGSATNRTSA
jgi:hypothetical protein